MTYLINYKSKEAGLSAEVIAEAVSIYNWDKAEDFKIDAQAIGQLYEDPSVTVNVAIDDVGVKKQKEEGRSPAKKRKETREYVHNTIAHIEKEDNQYILNGSGTVQVLKLLIAFLLYNGMLTGHYLQFFVDGARSLQGAIVTMFQWLPHVRIILDWYHLKKKCEYELSLVLNGSKIRNAVLEQLLPLLWLGKVDAAIAYIRNLSPKNLKTGQSVERLVGYFERNREYIPCYALRQKLRLRNSSNKGEKANDLCVASRQKHNGMSWSKHGWEKQRFLEKRLVLPYINGTGFPFPWREIGKGPAEKASPVKGKGIFEKLPGSLPTVDIFT